MSVTPDTAKMDEVHYTPFGNVNYNDSESLLQKVAYKIEFQKEEPFSVSVGVSGGAKPNNKSNTKPINAKPKPNNKSNTKPINAKPK